MAALVFVFAVGLRACTSGVERPISERGVFIALPVPISGDEGPDDASLRDCERKWRKS